MTLSRCRVLVLSAALAAVPAAMRRATAAEPPAAVVAEPAESVVTEPARSVEAAEPARRFIAAEPTAAFAAAEPARSFVRRLRAALAAGNRRATAAMFRYPLRVNAPSLPLPIPLDTAATTLGMYNLLFTPEMRCAIELAQEPQAGKPSPKYPLIVNGSVLTIGQGLIVAEQTAGSFRITRMTLIGVPDDHSRNAPRVTAEIDLRFQGMVRQVAGNLAGDAFDRYTVSATRGALLQARLERFRGLDAVLRVTDTAGHPVDATADGKRNWAAVIPASATYRVDVVRTLPFCDPPITYLLTLASR